jgi:hypothetical protein
MNPLTVIPLLVYALVATFWPGQIDCRRRGRELLIMEALIVAAAIGIGIALENLVVPRTEGLWWGQAGLIASISVRMRPRNHPGSRRAGIAPAPDAPR